MSILLGGVGGHPTERKKRPSTLNFIYEHPRTAPLGSGGALVGELERDERESPVEKPVGFLERGSSCSS